MSDTTQRPPQPDNRYRVNRSVKCYRAELACGSGGCTWYFSDSIERVVYLFPGRLEKVQYRNNFYALQTSDRMRKLVAEQLRTGGAVHIGGKHVVAYKGNHEFDAYPFIDTSLSEDRALYARFVREADGPQGNGDA